MTQGAAKFHHAHLKAVSFLSIFAELWRGSITDPVSQSKTQCLTLHTVQCCPIASFEFPYPAHMTSYCIKPYCKLHFHFVPHQCAWAWCVSYCVSHLPWFALQSWYQNKDV